MVGAPEHELTAREGPLRDRASRATGRSRAGRSSATTSGMFKMLFHRENRRLLGVHCIGTGATELVHVGQAVLGLGGGLDYFLQHRLQLPDAGRVLQGRGPGRIEQAQVLSGERIVAIHVALNHVTSYRYDRSVGLSPQLVRLRPAPHCRTPILSYSLRVTPEQHFVNWQQDPQSNYLARLVFPEKVRELRVEVDLVAEMAVYNPFDFFLEPHAEHVPFRVRGLAGARAPALPAQGGRSPRASPPTWRAVDARKPRRTLDFLVELNRKLQRDDPLRRSASIPGSSRRRRPSSAASGSCRDSTWLLVQLLRHLGLAARFVSGYLIQLTPGREGARRAGGAREGLHRPARLVRGLPAGRGLDRPRPDLGPPRRRGPHPARLHARARERGAGHRRGGRRARSSSSTRCRSRASTSRPRVTRPYYRRRSGRRSSPSAARWTRELERQDVRLTMGGEPTFVSADDRDGDEWNTAALGPDQAPARGRRCSSGCGSTTAPDGFVHFGQGKWYPGEQLPRWALGCYWRRDGEPAWSDPALFADETRGVRLRLRTRRERFLRALAVPARRRRPRTSRPGYEDVVLLPLARAPAARQRRSLRRPARRRDGARAPAPRVRAGPRRRSSATRCPSRRAEAAGALADRALVPAGRAHVPAPRRLADGLSPAARLAAVGEPTSDFPYVVAAGPDRAPRAAAALRGVSRARRAGAAAAGAVARPGRRARATPAHGRSEPRGRRAARDSSRRGIVRTALCVEPRAGVLYVFMPPRRSLEDYLELVAAVEATAAELRPAGPARRLPAAAGSAAASFLITPDPGVIEVNIQPAGSWDELVEQTTTLYDEARQPRDSSTEKFMLDGRHTGTGGGNHVVLGGPTARDSPFLRRPDLLRSLLALLAQPSVAVLPVLGALHRPHEPGPARGRGAPRQRLRAGDRVPAAARAAARRRRPGSWTACSATCWSTSPATPTARSSASTRCTRPTPRSAGAGCSSCGPSRCRRTRA